MKTIAWFSIGSGDEVSPKLVKALLKAHPGGSRFTRGWPSLNRPPREYFQCELLKEDSRVEQLVSILKDHGYRLSDGNNYEGGSNSKEIIFEYRREYDASDWNSSALLEFVPESYVGNVERNDEGVLILNADDDEMRENLVPFPAFEIGFVDDGTLICSGDLRAKLKASGLKRLCFKPILNEFNLKAGPIPGYWELTSDLILPPDTNSDIQEQFYAPKETHYRVADLKSVPEFDLALTHDIQSPIVSQRFYQFCVREKLNIKNWRPVRIDAD